MKTYINLNTPTASLDQLRTQVTAIDGQIISLIKQRIVLAKEMGLVKIMHDQSLRDQQREAHVMRCVKSMNNSSTPIIPEKELDEIFKTLIQICLETQRNEAN